MYVLGAATESIDTSLDIFKTPARSSGRPRGD
jgi:hypothetical protein